jgi:hypothetical protein
MTISAIAAGLLISTSPAFANTDDSQGLSVLWEQWALSIPTAVNPVLDTTGANCTVGQRDSVWFLAGVFGGGTATRTCSIPENTSLFFPVINAVNVNSPNLCGQGPANISVKDLRVPPKGFIDGASDLSVQLDGKPVYMARIRSAPFPVALPSGNIFDAPCGGPGKGGAGIFSPSVDDGYYSAVGPLKVGKHTLHIHAANHSAGFTLDVTYQLTVVNVLGNQDGQE